jgi:hypothetical protein
MPSLGSRSLPLERARRGRIFSAVAVVGLLSLALTACAGVRSAVSAIDDIARTVQGRQLDTVIDPRALQQVDDHLDDLRAIPNPNQAERSALDLAVDLVVYRESIEAAQLMAQQAEAAIPSRAAAINDEVLANVPNNGERFFIDADRVAAEMTESTVCGLAHELLSHEEVEALASEEVSFDPDASATFQSRAESFLLDQLSALGYSATDVAAVYPPLDVIKRVLGVANELVGDLETIQEANNPSTTRAFAYYYRLCVFR